MRDTSHRFAKDWPLYLFHKNYLRKVIAEVTYKTGKTKHYLAHQYPRLNDNASYMVLEDKIVDHFDAALPDL